LRPGGVFVDVGANTGYFSILAGFLVGSSGRVVAFEPNAEVRARLERHIVLNALQDHVIVSDVAVGGREQDAASFYLSCCAGNDGLSSLSRSAAAFHTGALRAEITATVRVRTFDAFAEQLGLGRIDLMKVDVEGAEHDVFAGMSRTLAACPPRQIVCETPRGSDTERLLAGYGYRVSVVDEVAGGTPNLLFVLDETEEK
jgi:FkbM family methyltransferase